MKRKEAFGQIRKHIGDLTCDRIREAAWELRLTGRHHEADRIEQASTVTHQLRSALAAMMVIASEPELKTCPNCAQRMDDHGPNCIVRALLSP